MRISPHPGLSTDSCMTRAAFLKGAAAFALSPFLAAPDAAAKTEPTEIAPGLFVHQGQHALVNAGNAGDIANISFIIGNEAVAVVDTGGSAHVGQAAREVLRTITDKPVRFVINTHMHPDHVFGNVAFEGDKPEYVAHHKMARGLAARADHYMQNNRQLIGDAAFEGTEIVMPTREIKDVAEIDLGGRILELRARPTAHTDNDLTILDKSTGTILLGDLLFSGHVPTLDGSIRGWLALIGAMRSEGANRVVPGHGPASMPWPEALDPLDRYLRTVADDVRAMIKSGKLLSEAAKTAGQSERGSWLLFNEHHVRNVTAAFAELEWE
jgi:quinoprotein relay system zinc metallohydrolase 2